MKSILDTNILVHQTCSCVSPLQCICSGGSGVTYVLGDMDLFCVQGETLTGKYLKWAKQKFTEPAGTRGLKPTEVCLNIHVHICTWMFKQTSVGFKPRVPAGSVNFCLAHFKYLPVRVSP